MDATTQARVRWYRLTPGRFLIGLLAVELLLWLSDRFGRLPWHKGYAVLTCVAVAGVGMVLMAVWLAVAVILRRRYQFSIRSLLVLVVVVASPCSWLAVKMEEARRQNAAVGAIRRADGIVSYDWQGIYSLLLFPKQKPRSPEWLRRLLGDDFWEDVVCVELGEFGTDALLRQVEDFPRLEELYVKCYRADHKITDKGLEHVQGLVQLRTLILADAEVTDAGLAHFAGLKKLERLSLEFGKITGTGLEYLKGLAQLRMLDLKGNQVTDDGLEHIRGLVRLRWLSLDSTNITDAEMDHLKNLTQLERLSVNYSDITDAGLDYLNGLTNLRLLELGETKVTDKGLQKLRQALPNCDIQH
jgi:hypothetical protein